MNEQAKPAVASVAVLVPCFNEVAAIATVVGDFHRLLPGARIYVYDNNSTDDTGGVAARAGAIARSKRLGAASPSVVTVNGLFRPFALVRGRAVATWSITAGEVVLAPFGRLSRTDERALRDDALDVARYLG